MAFKLSTRPANNRLPWISVLVGAGFALFFLLLRTQQFVAIDGAVRCLAVFNDPAWTLHGNNHMLYPFWIWLWTRGAALLGYTPADWLSFFRLCQAMNAVCAGTAIGILYFILASAAGVRYGLLGSLQFGLATAVVLHGTNSAEPVVAMLFAFSALAVLIPALERDNPVLLFLVGTILTLALASYQGMALVAPMVGFACACWPGTTRIKALGRLATVTAGGLLSLAIVYGWSYTSLGIPKSLMLKKFFTLDGDTGINSGFSLSKFLNVPLGYMANSFHLLPGSFTGVRSLLHASLIGFWAAALVCWLILAALLVLIAIAFASAVRQSQSSKGLLWAGILLSWTAAVFPLFWWGPLYDKLWLLPLATISIAAAFAFRLSSSNRTWRSGLVAASLCLIVVEAAVNIPRAVQDHLRPTPHLEEARALAGLVTSRDSIVLDFDDVSMLWTTIWGTGKNRLLLPASKRTDAEQWLAKAQQQSQSSGGSLFFVGVLDHDRPAWDLFIGMATRIPYAQFDCYRQNAAVLDRYAFSSGTVTVRRLQLPSACHL